MKSEIDLLDTIALLRDVPTKHATTGMPLTLRRGQAGAIVMVYEGRSFEVEFLDGDGRTIALLPISNDDVVRLCDAPVLAARVLEPPQWDGVNGAGPTPILVSGPTRCSL